MKGAISAALAIVVAAVGLAQNPAADDKRQLADLQKAYDAAKTALAKHPKSDQAKHRFVVAGDRFATATMTSSTLTSHEKYPKALRLYREVLKVAPSDHEASNNSEMIVSVYKSMHRPVPK